MILIWDNDIDMVTWAREFCRLCLQEVRNKTIVELDLYQWSAFHCPPFKEIKSARNPSQKEKFIFLMSPIDIKQYKNLWTKLWN